jgi:hypothetical protein
MSNLNYGLSGCKLEFLNETMIRKWSSSNQYNYRLYEQAIKQEIKSTKTYNTFAVPKIQNISKHELYFFDMEYIPSKSFNDYFYEISPISINKFMNFIDEYFSSITIIGKYSEDELKNVLYKKLNSFNNTKYINFIKYLQNYIKKIKFNNLYKEACHGDLTMSNILFTDEKYYLIDFLDSYLESSIIDLVKLKQDLYHHWLLKINQVNNIKAYQISTHIWNLIQLKYSYIINTELFNILEIINWLRIEPYLTESTHIFILDNHITNNNFYYEFNSTNSR